MFQVNRQIKYWDILTEIRDKERKHTTKHARIPYKMYELRISSLVLFFIQMENRFIDLSFQNIAFKLKELTNKQRT